MRKSVPVVLLDRVLIRRGFDLPFRQRPGTMCRRTLSRFVQVRVIFTLLTIGCSSSGRLRHIRISCRTTRKCTPSWWHWVVCLHELNGCSPIRLRGAPGFVSSVAAPATAAPPVAADQPMDVDELDGSSEYVESGSGSGSSI